MNEKIAQFVGKTENEFTRFGRGFKVGMLATTFLISGVGFLSDNLGVGQDVPASIERVIDVDAENLEELNLDRGTIVYNDTEDTYLVYLDDTEANPAQEAGWYEIDLNEAPIVPEGK